MSEQRLTELVEALSGRVTFALDGRAYTVPDRPLTVWLTALADGRSDAVVPALLEPADAAVIYDRLTDPEEPMDPDTCEEIGRWVIEQVAGRPWWEVCRLAAVAVELWNGFDGWCAERPLDPLQLTLRRFCNAFHRYALSLFPEADAREQWQAWLTGPPGAAALEDREEWADDAMGDAFAAVFGQHAEATGPASTG